MPSVSPTRPRVSACGSSPTGPPAPVRRCRSNASLTRSRSSFTAAATVSSSARLRPLRLLCAWSSSASLGAAWSRSNVPRSSTSAGWSALPPAAWNSSWRVASWAASTPANPSLSTRWRRASRTTLENACRRPAEEASAPSPSAWTTRCATHSIRCTGSPVACGSRVPRSAAKAVASVGMPSSGHASIAADSASTGPVASASMPSAAVIGGRSDGIGRSRSGANSTLSLSPAAPRAARSSLSSGSSTIGISRCPPCNRSR